MRESYVVTIWRMKEKRTHKVLRLSDDGSCGPLLFTSCLSVYIKGPSSLGNLHRTLPWETYLLCGPAGIVMVLCEHIWALKAPFLETPTSCGHAQDQDGGRIWYVSSSLICVHEGIQWFLRVIYLKYSFSWLSFITSLVKSSFKPFCFSFFFLLKALKQQ